MDSDFTVSAVFGPYASILFFLIDFCDQPAISDNQPTIEADDSASHPTVQTSSCASESAVGTSSTTSLPIAAVQDTSVEVKHLTSNLALSFLKLILE